MPLVLPAAIYRCILLTVTLQWVANADKLISENNYLLKTVGRRRREPAIWGEPAPDYSEAVLDEFTRYLKALLFVDKKIVSIFYVLLKFIHNTFFLQYFYQVNVRVTVVDVLEINKPNLTLHLFEEYRRSKQVFDSKLPEHDFAALMSYRYGGGLAFVGGMCTTKAVMLCGYYPQKPEGMGIIFFHEVAHLIGVPHRNQSTSRQVSNCSCQSSPSSKSTHKGCLKIPGFDDDCTLQELVNLLKTKQCLHKTEANAEPLIAKHSLQICGNGIIEGDEECDCGLRKYCNQWNCKPNSCKVVIKSWQMVSNSCKSYIFTS
uniref:Peptidase M12B domain-containing protein n=1 Tax=Syphacia muris TaxID=451379 RepID=A0A0N5AU05_9BILA